MPGSCAPTGSRPSRPTPKATRPPSAPTTAHGTEHGTEHETQPRTLAVLLAARAHPGLLPASRALAGRHHLPGRNRLPQAARTRRARLDGPGPAPARRPHGGGALQPDPG